MQPKHPLLKPSIHKLLCTSPPPKLQLTCCTQYIPQECSNIEDQKLVTTPNF